MLEVEVLGVEVRAGRSAAATDPWTAIELPLEEVRHLCARAAASAGVSDGHVAIEFVDERRISELNARYRGRAEPTDVLSFPAVDRRAPVSLPRRGASGKGRRSKTAEFLGDIAISPSTARRNAKKLGRTLPSELQILILHGMLHLLGYDHETDHGEMDRVETRLRRRLGLA